MSASIAASVKKGRLLSTGDIELFSLSIVAGEVIRLDEQQA